MKLRKIIPNFIGAKLWGDRLKFGLQIQPDDEDWKEWQKTVGAAYIATQRKGIGNLVNDAGYRVISDIDLTGKQVLEVGAGDIQHLKYINGQPSKYFLADVSSKMMELAKVRLQERDIIYQDILLKRNQHLPFEDSSIDVIVSFYSLEHLYPLKPYLEDIYRVLKPGGFLIGAIPAEGGLAWGFGRMITSRKWFRRNTHINLDKIICWEHPNFADDIIKMIDQMFSRKKVKYWPFSLMPFLDVNLIIQFVYTKPMR
jgi:ubiquinone/menaquinone biosynthesis C-methylase UbiE